MATVPENVPPWVTQAVNAFNEQLHGRTLIVVNELEDNRVAAWQTLFMAELVSSPPNRRP